MAGNGTLARRMTQQPESAARRYGKVFVNIVLSTIAAVLLILTSSSTRHVRSRGSGAAIVCLRLGVEVAS